MVVNMKRKKRIRQTQVLVIQDANVNARSIKSKMKSLKEILPETDCGILK